MKRDDITRLSRHPLIRLHDGRTAWVVAPKMDDNFWRVEIQDFEPLHEDDTADKVLHIREFDSFVRDKCQVCRGERGGMPGNENIMYGMTVCDYCSSDLITVEREVRDETLRAAARIAMMAEPVATGWGMRKQIIEQIESVRLVDDGRWQSEAAMKLWGEAANDEGVRLHEQFNGNGRPRHGG